MSDVPLRRHALLSDCGCAALVTDSGSVDWLCLRRFDSAPVFARLLDPAAGHFLIAPVDDDPDHQAFSTARSTSAVVVADGGAATLVLSTKTPLQIADTRATAVLVLHEGQELAFALQSGDPRGPQPQPWGRGKVSRRLEATETSCQS